ncbi:MAG TPA: 4-hydroxy-3-methylbut-2-enyl diphosphate reductase [Opitutaceae bacterium]|nr:4-hydroxy-3-methylbut-2-enyl diphosphate reductase [Opitutaceae bacterium]HND61436.1 4-hydroxy-3-methylbut-2-enyl diphosphate reductase [Opitutaceae bacterium]
MASPTRFAILAFNASNQLAVRRTTGGLDVAFRGATLPEADAALAAGFRDHLPPAEYFTTSLDGEPCTASFTQVAGQPATPDLAFLSLDALAGRAAELSPALAALLGELDPHLVDIPYLHLGENDFIYKFRPAQERNVAIYGQDALAGALYQSQLCAAIKALARQHERSAAAPVVLDFGAVQYVIPSHFGFCLGVKNAIERAYETLAENPGRRVFMLSELIHNPFVNEDLLRRGLRYLQTDQGEPYVRDGRRAREAPGEPTLWDTLTPDDIVIIPAFGATDDDKRRLVRKGIAVYHYDATCMLVEKVWKAARAYGREGFTVIIHGKHEHEETKATFSNTRRWAPAVIVRNLDEARQLGELAGRTDEAAQARFSELFAGRHTPGFSVARHLERVAVVNQTTLLMNETLSILDHLRTVYRERFGDDTRVGGSAKRDTLCYATQVNQDALSRALGGPLDAAFVIGGRNSSNTYQLFRLCELKLGARAYFIQSEASIRSLAEVDHYVYVGSGSGRLDARPLWTDANGPRRVLITGGASCPDGIIQQVITRINGFFPPEKLRSTEDVLRDLGA